MSYDFGPDISEEAAEAEFLSRLPELLRSRCCRNESYAGPDPAVDHGHTDCYFMGLAAREIDDLRARLAAAEDALGTEEMDKVAAEARAERAEADADRLAAAILVNGPWGHGLSPGQTAILDALAAHDAAVAERPEP